MSSIVRRSTTEIGTAFEKHSQRYLNHHLHMSVRRVGGAGDGGVDLRGSWYIPNCDITAGPSKQRQTKISESGERIDNGGDEMRMRRLRVVGQCKAEKKSLGPRAVRELEGVVAHLEGTAIMVPAEIAGASRKGKERSLSPDVSLPENDTSSEIIAILLSQSGFSKNAMLHAFKSHTPLMLVHLPGGQVLNPTSEKAGTDISGLWWNAALSGPGGILCGKLEMRREILEGSSIDEITGDTVVRVRYGIYEHGRRLERIGPPLGNLEEI